MSAGGFSRRTAWAREPSELAKRIASARERGEELTDLSQSNPTRAGLCDAAALGGLSDPAAALYAPEPRGLLASRESVVR